MLKLKQKYSPADYLEMEEVADYRSEYYQGEVFAMAGETLNHNRIALDLCASLNQRLAGQPCEAFAENIKVWAEAVSLFAYPDVIVVCGEPEFYPNRTDIILNPLVVVEVQSVSTRKYDRGGKFDLYRAVPSFKEYLILDQYRIHVEQYVLNEVGQWDMREYRQASDSLSFSSIPVEIPLQEIYRRVRWNS